MRSMFTGQVRQQIEHELKQAKDARQAGMEGRARVHCRRAAGAAIRYYYKKTQGIASEGNAMDLLAWLEAEALTPHDLRTIAAHLLTRVDEDYKLPIEADLIAETQTLVERLNEMMKEKE